MSSLPDFRLETFLSQWEFSARYHLTASDMQALSVSELLTYADTDDRDAWDALALSYTETSGDPGLRQAIANSFKNLESDDVLCFAGAEEGLYLAMHVLLGPDDHAVVVTPNYQAAESVPLSICEASGVALDPHKDWALDLGAVAAEIRPNTRVVSVCFPNNPTGKVIDEADLRDLVNLCDERGITLFSDEVYRGLERDPARTLPQAADLSPRALSLNVTSKALGLPGLRIGWIACRDRELLTRLERAKHYTTICNSAPSEVLARIALKAREPILSRNRTLLATNLPHFEAFFAEFPDLFEWQAPDGGCVCFPRYMGPDGVESFCEALLAEAGVLTLPASIYRSALTPTPTDRFRIGMGRANAQSALEAFAAWLRARG